MNIIQLPFNQLIGISKADCPDFLLMLEKKSDYNNHLGTVHAAALYALAEAGSAQFLVNNPIDDFPDLIAVVRKAEVKYSGAANGKIYVKANFVNANTTMISDTLKSKKRILIQTTSQLYDENHKMVMNCMFEWFVSVNSDHEASKTHNNQVK